VIDIDPALSWFQQSMIAEDPESSDLLHFYDPSPDFPENFSGAHTLDAVLSPAVIGTADVEYFSAVLTATIYWFFKLFIFSAVFLHRDRHITISRASQST
jgi:hypothetical protein